MGTLETDVGGAVSGSSVSEHEVSLHRHTLDQRIGTPWLTSVIYRYFKSKILDPLEERSLIQTLRVPYPLLTPQDHASSLLASLKSTRRRQRELAATPEIGLGTGFRLKGQAKKEWEDKVYGLEVEKEEVREWKDEWVVRVGGLDVEGEEYKRLKEDWGSGARETQKDPVEFGPTSAEDKAFYPPESLDIPDLVPSKTLPHLLLNPNLIPPHLLPDPRTESPLPLPPKSDLPTPSLLHTHLTLSHPSIHPRWASAIAGELTARKILIMEEEEAKARKVERRQMYSKLREGKRRLKDEEMRNLVEGGEGREGDELRGKVEGIRGGREFKFWEKDARMVSQGGGAGAGAGVRVKREDRAGSWRVEAEKSGKYGLRRGASALESRA